MVHGGAILVADSHYQIYWEPRIKNQPGFIMFYQSRVASTDIGSEYLKPYMIIRECQGFSIHPIVIGYPLRLVFWDVKANTYRIITPPLVVPNMCKSPVLGVLKDGMGEGVSGLDGVSHHVGKPRLLEQKMGPENGVISWLPDIIYI